MPLLELDLAVEQDLELQPGDAQLHRRPGCLGAADRSVRMIGSGSRCPDRRSRFVLAEQATIRESRCVGWKIIVLRMWDDGIGILGG
jgi:hypothetical protein